ncbi:MAG TPA: hypothetical protein P5121_19900 [Caldilineaceae bacterium]|nr:hypothetical protein [Caldilineaceae bacterium]
MPRSPILCLVLSLLVAVAGTVWDKSAYRAVGALLCAQSVGNEPTQPFTPVDAWIALQDGGQHWYAFRDEGDDTPIRIRLTVVPENGATFFVLTPAQMLAWQRGEPFEPVGAGSLSTVFHGDRYWTGSFVQSGIYYVLVESMGRGLSNYMLSIQGTQVSFPLLTFIPPQPPIAIRDSECAVHPVRTPTADTAPLAGPTVTPTPGQTRVLSSPDESLPPIGKEYIIQPGEVHWYAFRDEGDAGAITIRATATPANCMAFALWTPEQLRLWRQNIEFQPVGEGTINRQLNGDLFWTGSFVKSGIYHVVVTHDPTHDPASTSECTYQLRVTGDDVTLVLPSRMP